MKYIFSGYKRNFKAVKKIYNYINFELTSLGFSCKLLALY